MNQTAQKQLRRLALDLGPVLLFFGAFKFSNIYVATGIFMVAVTVALAVGYWLERKI
jgi:intracellular septation protein